MASLLLLIKDVEDLGRSGDVVKVKPGYARNYLLPKGYAVAADKNALRIQEKLKEERRQKAESDKKESEELSSALSKLVLSAVVKVDHEGHMYGSVSALDLHHMLEEQHGILLDKRSVLLKHPIKSIGEHKVELKLKEGVMSSLTLVIKSEEMKEQDAAKAEEPAE